MYASKSERIKNIIRNEQINTLKTINPDEFLEKDSDGNNALSIAYICMNDTAFNYLIDVCPIDKTNEGRSPLQAVVWLLQNCYFSRKTIFDPKNTSMYSTVCKKFKERLFKSEFSNLEKGFLLKSLII